MAEHLLSLDAGRVEDREIFAGIVRRYQNLVTALTFSMTGNLQQSEDLAQETFVAAWRSLTGGASRPDVASERLGPWLCGIARNLTHNWLRRTTRERHTPHVPAEGNAVSGLSAADDPQNDETELSREMQAALVWETLRHIPSTYREPLAMFYRRDASIREIAEALGLTEVCVRQRISRGRAMLKGEVANRFESFLTQIRPGEHFTVAVLAAIPILATGKQTMAASAAGLAAAQSASSGGGGHPLFAGITASCWKFVCGIGPFLTVFIGTILGVWSGVRHAPTRRARLLMLKTVLEYYTLCSVFATLFAAYHAYMVWYVRLIYSNDTKLMAFYLICMVLAPVYVTLNSIRVNRKWRQCVEFGSEAEVKEPTSGHMYPAEGCIPDGMQMENYGGTFSTERSIPTECLPVEYNPLKCRPLKCNPLGLQRSVETTSQQTTLHSLGMRPPVEKPENHNRERLHEPHVISRINVIILLGIAFVFNSILYGIFVYMGFFLINANLSYWDRGLLLSFPTALIIFL